VQLPRRSLQLQLAAPKGQPNVRYDYQHGISQGDILAPRRVSITFRQAKLD
jgi:hypothetical protein